MHRSVASHMGLYSLSRHIILPNHVLDDNLVHNKQQKMYSVCGKTFELAFRLNIMYNNGNKKVQVGKDQEKAQSEKDSHSKNRG